MTRYIGGDNYQRWVIDDYLSIVAYRDGEIHVHPLGEYPKKVGSDETTAQEEDLRKLLIAIFNANRWAVSRSK